MESCRKLDINPPEYFKELLDALPTMQQSEAADWPPARRSKSNAIAAVNRAIEKTHTLHGTGGQLETSG